METTTLWVLFHSLLSFDLPVMIIIIDNFLYLISSIKPSLNYNAKYHTPNLQQSFLDATMTNLDNQPIHDKPRLQHNGTNSSNKNKQAYESHCSLEFLFVAYTRERMLTIVLHVRLQSRRCSKVIVHKEFHQKTQGRSIIITDTKRPTFCFV